MDNYFHQNKENSLSPRIVPKHRKENNDLKKPTDIKEA
jgi:hypothetical protein